MVNNIGLKQKLLMTEKSKDANGKTVLHVFMKTSVWLRFQLNIDSFICGAIVTKLSGYQRLHSTKYLSCR